MIPRDENDQLLVTPEEFSGTKWQYYRPLLFLADNMGKSRNSYNSQYDDSNYELLHQFEPAIEIPSDDELSEDDTKPEISPKLHQRLMAQAVKAQMLRDESPPNAHNNSNRQNQRPPPKLRAIPQLNMMDMHNLLTRSTVGQTTISPAPMHHLNHQQMPNAPTSSTSSNAKRRKTDEVTTTGCGASSNDEYPSVSSPNLPNSSNDDDNFHFLMSLQPYLAQFTGPQKLRIRMRIQKLIFKELYKDEIDDWGLRYISISFKEMPFDKT